MKAPLKALLTAVAAALVAVALLASVAGAGGSATDLAATGMMGGDTGSWCGGGIWSGTGTWGGTGMWGTGPGARWLAGDPAAQQAWLHLRTEHQRAMRAWYDTNKAGLTSSEAQQSLHDLWISSWNDMKDFYEQYGHGAVWTSPSSGMWGGWSMGGMMDGASWDPLHMWGSGYGASWMVHHPAGFGRWLAMRGRQISAMNAWWQANSSEPGGLAAQDELRALRAHQRSQVRRFYERHRLSVTTRRMRQGAGGWMGLGGMWGGFGW